jgi:hypothetical protein
VSLTVNVAQRTGSFTVALTFTSAEDYDLHVFDKFGNEVGKSTGTNGAQESATIPCPDPNSNPYKVRVVYFQTFADTQTYHATATFNNTGVCPPPPSPTYNNNALTFAPATIVSAHFLGVEPQTVMERTNAPWVPVNNPGGIDNKRIFVDWPLSSRSHIGQLSRSMDSSDSFRLLIDQTCAARSRPNCATGGGGDTESDVNLKNGNVFFGDQESLANEAEATSTNHGDSFVFQTALSNGTSATDREWIATTDSSQQLGGQPIEAFFSYHVPPNAYVHAITEATHLPVPQPVPQLKNIGQSGQIKVDNNPSSPSHGWIYYPANGLGIDPLVGGTMINVVKSTDFQLPTNWHQTLVEPNGADSFPWVAIDKDGNSYVTFDSGGVVYYAYSLITDPRNNPNAVPAGVPGTIWSSPARITPPGIVTSAVFPEVIAGADAGRIGVTYMGSEDYTGVPNGAPASSHWHAYAAVITGADTSNPVIFTGKVSHRVVHHGNICTNGTTCGLTGDPTQDRSLADMIDVGFDADGRLGVVFMDNNTKSFQDDTADATGDPTGNTKVDQSPFVYFAKEITGQTLFANTSPVNIGNPSTGFRDDPAGEATWPNIAGSLNIQGLDIERTLIEKVGSNVVAHLKLANASLASMTGAITTYNATVCAPPCQAQRLQYIVRFNTADEAYHMSLEVLPDGTLRAFGGKLDSNDSIVNPGSPTSVIAAGYHTDAGYTVTSNIVCCANGEITLTAPASQFGIGSGTNVYSVTGLATAGPTEGLEGIGTTGNPPQTAAYIMRTVDASPPFDYTFTGTTGVRLVYFTTTRVKNTKSKVLVKWKTGAEPETAGFRLYRQVGTKKTRIGKLFLSKGATGGVYSYTDLLPKTVAKACYALDVVSTQGVASPISKVCMKK